MQAEGNTRTTHDGVVSTLVKGASDGDADAMTTAEPQAGVSGFPFRRRLYPILVLVVFVVWTTYMFAADQFGLFNEHWPVSLTMVFGSVVAGATPQGGAAVAFPVFTKVLEMPAGDARTFGLMIQSVGMTMAAITILVRRTPILPKMVIWSSLGGSLGVILGSTVATIPAPYPKILFTLSLTVFAGALVISRWVLDWPVTDRLPAWNTQHAAVFALVGLVGGIFVAHTGAGVDGMAFVVLTLAYGIDERVSTPSTVIVMAVLSVVGFAVQGLVLQDIGVAFDYWLVAVPIVVLGAPLGAFLLTKLSREILIGLILTLITAEMLSTVFLIDFDSTMVLVTVLVMTTSAALFALMLMYRRRHTDFTSEPANGSGRPIDSTTASSADEQLVLEAVER